ncbi:hypothetical protein [Acanthamoeba polyphaga mimivirus]|nr:hypothetical protein [Acanthamoeba castellanii mamavirus]EJN41066.1 hypothetical protein lvs_R563 [Acanthamoeba polyphaga lentillevirus]UMZ07807.1 hypothetical protein [Acanthamoeba polyphaga mimivirus]
MESGEHDSETMYEPYIPPIINKVNTILRSHCRQCVLDLIFKKIKEENVHCYGDYVRYMLIGYDSNRIRVRFKSEFQATFFRKQLEIYLSVKNYGDYEDSNCSTMRVRPKYSNKYFRNFILSNEYIMKLFEQIPQSRTSYLLNKLRKQFKKTRFYLEFYYETSLNYTNYEYIPVNCDFDVDTLMVDKQIYEKPNPEDFIVINPKCKVENVINNINNMQFIILTKNGSPLIQHYSEDIVTGNYDDDYYKFYLDELMGRSHCIDRYSASGKRILSRKEILEDEGWVCINLPCPNQNCVLFENTIGICCDNDETVSSNSLNMVNFGPDDKNSATNPTHLSKESQNNSESNSKSITESPLNSFIQRSGNREDSKISQDNDTVQIDKSTSSDSVHNYFDNSVDNSVHDSVNDSVDTIGQTRRDNASTNRPIYSEYDNFLRTTMDTIKTVYQKKIFDGDSDKIKHNRFSVNQIYDRVEYTDNHDCHDHHDSEISTNNIFG